MNINSNYLTSKRAVISIYTPTAFCAFLSLYALYAPGSSPGSRVWKPVFFAFLPMCFFYIGMLMHCMINKINALQSQIDEKKQ